MTTAAGHLCRVCPAGPGAKKNPPPREPAGGGRPRPGKCSTATMIQKIYENKFLALIKSPIAKYKPSIGVDVNSPLIRVHPKLHTGL